MIDVQAPGFRFFPTEEELVGFYLNHKLAKQREAELERFIHVADVYCYDPWQLPHMVGATRFSDDDELFFFCPRNERETNGGRPNRITPSGYWKATGIPGLVFSSQNQAIGVKRTLVFYEGRASTGKKTKWKMNEYKSLAGAPQGGSMPSSVSEVRSEVSLCRLYIKSGCIRAFDRRPPLSPSVKEMDSKKLKTCSYKGSGSNFEGSQGVEKEEKLPDDPIDWLMLGDLDLPWESISSI